MVAKGMINAIGNRNPTHLKAMFADFSGPVTPGGTYKISPLMHAIQLFPEHQNAFFEKRFDRRAHVGYGQAARWYKLNRVRGYHAPDG